MFNLLSVADPAASTATGSPVTGVSTPISQSQAASVHALRSEVIDGIQEIMDEVSQVDDHVAGFAEVQINPGDHVLVYQPSPTVEKFLVRAASKRRYTVFIASDPLRNGVDEATLTSLPKKLGSLGVTTIKITSGSLAAYMPKVDKVILSCIAIVADGGVISSAGARIVARAAREHSKPVIVLTGVYKLCPEEPYDIESLIEYGDSSAHVSFADGSIVTGVEVENATTDFVPAELIDVYITNL
jgi:translation initiation factor eIF-2B subunit beta